MLPGKIPANGTNQAPASMQYGPLHSESSFTATNAAKANMSNLHSPHTFMAGKVALLTFPTLRACA